MSRTRTGADPAGNRLPPLLPLALITGISPIATDMYIAALPAIAQDLHTSASVAQLSLTAFLAAFAVGQLCFGPVGDAVGRRRIILLGTGIFAIAAAVCAVASNASVLIGGRLLQGLAGAAGTVSTRAMVTDVLTGTARARTIAAVSSITAVGPVVAPLVGGALLTIGSWRLVFWTLAVVGLGLFVWALLTFPETLTPARRSEGTGLGASLRRMGTLLASRRLALYLATFCVGIVGFFAYISTSSFVFQRFYGFSEVRYTLVFATNAVFMIIATLVFRRLVGRVTEDRLLSMGLIGGTTAALGVLVSALASAPAGVVWACLALVTGSWGFVLTGAATRIQALGSVYPGTAAALQGGLAFGLGSLGTPLAGALGGTPTAMGAVMLTGLGVAGVLQLAGPRLLR